jgi:hypothetical protein
MMMVGWSVLVYTIVLAYTIPNVNPLGEFTKYDTAL